ncbi:MAG: N-acetyl-gamma-glutamyl-phosphate reductase [Thaumarchaeota archaeon]|nr:MAG: N-acetyl-gamma-glutamyl-phosphate reductase [Nitrososphaerota archaeon]
MSVKVAIIGASGYTGGELLRILALHGEVEVVAATSREYAGKPIPHAHPHLRGFYRAMRFIEVNLDKILEADVVFLSLPAGGSLNYVPKLLESGLKVVDLGPDYRLKNPEDYVRWYGFEHPHPDLLKKAIYGMPELYRSELANARLIASPGCNSTAAILSLIPAVKEKLIDLDHIAIDVKVGSSEAGRKPAAGTHHPERENVIRPYEASGHRHVAEVEQELSKLAGKDLKIAFVPHAVGSIRGALATSHTWLVEGVDEKRIIRAYASIYGKEPFVRIIRGPPVGYPDPKYVIGSNFADVGFAYDERVGRAAFMAAIDNLMKGAAGQAVQAFNIMMGFDEGEGLVYPPLKPA